MKFHQAFLFLRIANLVFGLESPLFYSLLIINEHKIILTKEKIKMIF